MTIAVFWNVTFCNHIMLTDVSNRRKCLHPQGIKVKENLFIPLYWRGSTNVVLKLWYLSANLHDVTSKETIISQLNIICTQNFVVFQLELYNNFL
jgi:LytS/YehU family sensor histidine kinase